MFFDAGDIFTGARGRGGIRGGSVASTGTGDDNSLLDAESEDWDCENDGIDISSLATGEIGVFAGFGGGDCSDAAVAAAAAAALLSVSRKLTHSSAKLSP